MHITDLVTKKVANSEWSIKRAKLIEATYHALQATVILFSAALTIGFAFAIAGLLSYHLPHLITIACILFAISAVVFNSSAFKEANELTQELKQEKIELPPSNKALERHMNFLKKHFYSFKRDIIDLADVLGKDIGDLSWFFAKLG